MEEPNGYINASWIDMHGGNFHRQWIAAQGPTQKTIGSFWRCVWETETSLILMLTRLFENANSKCDKYWPDEGFEQEYGSFYVANENELNHSFFIERKLKLTHIITGKEKPGELLPWSKIRPDFDFRTVHFRAWSRMTMTGHAIKNLIYDFSNSATIYKLARPWHSRESRTFSQIRQLFSTEFKSGRSLSGSLLGRRWTNRCHNCSGYFNGANRAKNTD